MLKCMYKLTNMNNLIIKKTQTELYIGVFTQWSNKEGETLNNPSWKYSKTSTVLVSKCYKNILKRCTSDEIKKTRKRNRHCIIKKNVLSCCEIHSTDVMFLYPLLCSGFKVIRRIKRQKYQNWHCMCSHPKHMGKKPLESLVCLFCCSKYHHLECVQDAACKRQSIKKKQKTKNTILKVSPKTFCCIKSWTTVVSTVTDDQFLFKHIRQKSIDLPEVNLCCRS